MYNLPYVSKHYSNREKQVIPFMIPKGKGWRYLAVKNYQDYKEEELQK